ncbi:MAG TPA: PAS domain S-box protein [Candidatus Obscuribacterales bacterium]
MADQVISFSLSQFYSLANATIGACYAVIAVALLVYLARRKTTRQAFIFLCIFFLMAGLSRLAKALDFGPADTAIKVTLDLATALLGIPMAVIIWPLLSTMAKLPTAAQLKEANEKLEESNHNLIHSQQLFEGFMHHSPALQFVKDAQLRFLYVNDSFCHTFDMKRDHILGKTNQECLPPEAVQSLHASDIRVLQTLQPTEEVHTLPTVSGPRTWLIVKFPIWDSQLMIGCVGIDVTEQKAAENRERRLTGLFRTMVDAVKEYAIFMLDADGNVLTWNQGAERLKGYKAEEIIGQHFSVFYPAEALETNHPHEELAVAKANGQFQEEGWRKRKDGSYFWANVTITAVHENGKLIGFTKVTRDMSDRRALENQLATQRDKALEASATKSAFVANISHEIRTPLSGILGMNELLLQTDLTEEQRELARTVQESSQSLLVVLNDVLDLSKVEAGRLFLERIPFNVSFATQDATRLMSATAKNKRLVLTHQLDTRIPELLMGDPERFRQVLLNLVGNAVKFTQKGEVSVTAELVSETATTATIKFLVKDTGIGISPEDRRHLFVPFGQVDASPTRRHGGTGLGLTISKHLVVMMGGEIGVQSEKDKGSTFWFTIPFPKTNAQAADVSARSGGINMPTMPTALIVEDNHTLQDLAVKQLANLGIKSMLAGCGAEAIEAVNGTQFDIIFMDVALPNVDGYEATRTIRQIERSRNRRTPIIGMTGKTMTGDNQKALDAGMDDYITKPVSLERLRQVCEKWLSERTSR